MNKHLIYTLLFLTISSLTFAQSKKGKTFKIKETFNSLEVIGQIETILIPTTEKPKMIIYTSDLNLLEREYDNNKLKLKVESSFFSTEKEVEKPKVEIYYNRPIQSIKLVEATLSNQDTLQQISIDLVLEKNAKADLNVLLKKFNVKASKGSTSFIKGEVLVNEVNLSSGSVLEAEKLIADLVDVKVKGSGTIAYVYATTLLEAFSTTQGLIRVNGSPIKVVKEESLGGSIISMDKSSDN